MCFRINLKKEIYPFLREKKGIILEMQYACEYVDTLAVLGTRRFRRSLFHFKKGIAQNNNKPRFYSVSFYNYLFFDNYLTIRFLYKKINYIILYVLLNVSEKNIKKKKG